jgi:hypothetical protein
MFLASFQGVGKWLSWKQWLNKRVKCTRGILGRCRRHSFGMPCRPQAFRDIKYCISFKLHHKYRQRFEYMNVILWLTWHYVRKLHFTYLHAKFYSLLLTDVNVYVTGCECLNQKSRSGIRRQQLRALTRDHRLIIIREKINSGIDPF